MSSKMILEKSDFANSALERIEKTRIALKMSKAEFCRLIDYDRRYYASLFSRNGAPGYNLLRRIVQSSLVNGHWLLTGEGSMFREDGPESSDEDIVRVPVLEVSLSAGHGVYPPETEEPQDTRPFRRMDVRRMTNSTRRLSIVYVYGDSMEPTLEHGDEVMVDRSPEDVLREGLYAVRLDDGLLIKRLHMLGQRRIQLCSDNPLYKPIEVDMTNEAEGFDIIGRVLWGGRTYG